MLDIQTDLYFIPRLTCQPALINNSGEESSLLDYLILCYYRLNETVTCLLSLLKELQSFSQIYYRICLLIRPTLIHVLCVQFMLSLISVEGVGNEQIQKVETMASLYLKDGAYEMYY